MSKPNGQVFLCKNAIIDSSYNHTIDFKNPDEQLAYWGSLTIETISNYSYIRRTSQMLKIAKTLDELKEINYLYFRSGPDLKMYYCFVTSKEYANDNMTYVYYEVDVLQTYMFDYNVKQSYVLQEHADRWDANHKPIFSRTEEGLDYGAEYMVESAYRIKPNHNIKWYLAVCKDHSSLHVDGHNTKEPAKVINVANPYIYYLLPVEKDQTNVTEEIFTFYFKAGSESKFISVKGLMAFTELMAESATGNFVQHIIKLPYLPFNFSTLEGVIDSTTETRGVFNYTKLGEYNFIRILQYWENPHFMKTLAEMGIFEGIESSMPTAEQWAEIKANPYTTERDKRFESKLLTHPYRYNILTDNKNQPAIIKNEFIGGDKIKINFTQGLSYNSPARYWVEGYKKDPEGRHTSVVQNIQEDSPVVTDEFYTYMLQNKNQISANQTNAMISVAAQATQGAVQGAIGGAMSGGLLGAIFGGVSGGASSAVNGALNYQGMIRSENAKQKDIKNLPDNIVCSNDSAFNIQDNNEWLTLYRMKICCEFEELLADTFNMTGYTVKRVKVPNLKTRARFNYVKTMGANIVGSFDQNDLAKIRQIFDNGITFWHWNKDNFNPFDYSLENIETKLL